MENIIKFFSNNPWIWAIVAVALIILIWVIVKISGGVKKKKLVKTEADKVEAEKARVEEEKRLKEEVAANAFQERRSIDLDVVEANRKVEGASAVTGKKNY